MHSDESPKAHEKKKTGTADIEMNKRKLKNFLELIVNNHVYSKDNFAVHIPLEIIVLTGYIYIYIFKI